MGQYYNIILQEKGKRKIKAYDRTIDGNYTMAKLMEHSWYNNDMTNAICELLYNNPHKIAWVGDYADSFKHYDAAWERDDYIELKSSHFKLNDFYLVNHTKKIILDCWEYVVNSIKRTGDSWVIHPLPLLTCVGNGGGGGDYRGINEEDVGSWCWDLVEIVGWEKQRELIQQGYVEKMYLFKE